jgi:hypothetical protein
MFYLLLCLIGFILLILGTWEGGNMKNRENKKCFQKAKKSRLSLPDLHTSHRQTANALMFVGRGAGAKDISGRGGGGKFIVENLSVGTVARKTKTNYKSN